MRAASLVLTVLLTASSLSGCELPFKKKDCVAQPGLTTGYGQVCSAPPPGDFGKLGN